MVFPQYESGYEISVQSETSGQGHVGYMWPIRRCNLICERQCALNKEVARERSLSLHRELAASITTVVYMVYQCRQVVEDEPAIFPLARNSILIIPILGEIHIYW